MSASSSTSSANLETSSLNRLTGTNLYSGLDTDKIIKALVSNTQSRIDKQGQLEQIAEWKRDLYRGVSSAMQDLEKTYFSYTSDTNLLSPNFFKTSTIKSSSGVVSATGNVGNAESLVINSISQIASKACYNSSQRVSDEAITSGKIYNSWTQSSLGGKSLKVNYNGTDYTLTMSYAVKLDSENSTVATVDGKEVKTVNRSELQKVVDGLNDQVSQNSSLNGKVSFSLNADNKIVLTSADNHATSLGIKAYTTDSDQITGKNFLAALGLSETTQSSTESGQIVLTGNHALNADVNTSALFNQTIPSSSYLKLKLGSDEFTVKLGNSVTISGASESGYAKIVSEQLQKQINADSSLNGKITVSADPATGKITFNSTNGQNLSVSGGSQDLLRGFEIPTSDTPSSTSVVTSGVNVPDLFKSYFGDTLAGNTLSFTLDGISKTVSFDASDESSYYDPASGSNSISLLKNYLQTKLDRAFGTDKVKVSADTDSGTLKFETGANSVLSVTSSDTSNVLNRTGALRITSGETNRAETTKTLSQLAGEFHQPLTAGGDGKYTISINGKELSFDGNTELGAVITKINDDEDMGVTVAYSQTNDSFCITADDSGANGTVTYSDVSGNLASTLFGTYNAASYTAGKDLKMNVTINGSTSDIERSSNNTTLDGVKLSVTGTTSEAVSFSTESNVDDLSKKIVDFVNAYNKIIDQVNTLTSQSPERNKNHKVKYQPLTDDAKKDMTADEIDKWNTEAKKGLLQNDSTLNGILNDMREAMVGAVESSGLTLSQLGISSADTDITSGGQLAVKTDTLKDKLQSDPDAVTKLFTGEDGIAQRVKKALDKYVGTFGGDGALIQLAGKDSQANDTSQLTTQIRQYQSTISDLKDQLQTQEDRYWDKFTAMEQSLSRLTAQSNYLNSMFNNGSSS